MEDVVTRRPAFRIGPDASTQRAHRSDDATGRDAPDAGIELDQPQHGVFDQTLGVGARVGCHQRKLRFLFRREVHFHASQRTPKFQVGQVAKPARNMRLPGHQLRPTSLVQLAPRYRGSFDGECDTLAQLIAGAIELGPPVARAAVGTLAWRFLAYPGGTEDAPFLAFAILLTSALGKNDPFVLG
jgi:hypothetical protein